RGVSTPGSSSSSSSRGEKPLPARRTDAVLARQLEFLTAHGPQPARPSPLRLQPLGALRTRRRPVLSILHRLPPRRGRALVGDSLQHPDAQPRPARVKLPLDLGQGGPWMLRPPVSHPA